MVSAAPAEMTPAQKAAKKKERMAAKKLPPPTPSPRLLSTVTLFDGVPKKAMDAIYEKAEGKTLLRDDMLTKPGDTPDEIWVNFIVAGQVGVGEHTEAAQKAVGMKAKAELFKKVGQTIAVLARGDFWSDDFSKNAGGLCLYSIVETQVIRIKAKDLNDILAKHTAVLDRLRRHGEKWLHRIASMREDGGRDEIFDFYVKNGFSFSTRTKIRQLELCIDCDKCVIGCEDRHGFARLERFGPQVGLINFSVSCRQCYDPRCLSDCNFDAIARDPLSHEIRVNMEDCTGCGVCARSCPNDSIFVHQITDDMDTSMWSDRGKKVPKKVAVKCDRCAGYDDMACISACPTGSMIDAIPELIFGLDSSKPVDESCAPDPFEQGWSAGSTPRTLPKILYGLSALILIACVAEWVFRRWMPEYIFMPVFEEDLVKSIRYNPDYGLGMWLGIIGSICMLSTLIYVIRNRFESSGFIGSKYFWFSFHNALGVLGPALVFLHGNLLFATWPSIGVWASLLVVASGLLGQYLANQIPGKQYKNTRERQDLDRGLQQLSQQWGEHTRSVNVAEMMMQAKIEKSQADVENMGTLRFLLNLVTADIRRALMLFKLKLSLKKVKNKAVRKQLLELKKEQLRLEHQDVFFKTAGRLVSQWRLFHIFFSVGIFLVMALHVAQVTIY